MGHLGGPPRFPVTPWSIIREAAITGTPGSQEALARLCEAYWYPLYTFIRRTGHDRENAQDLVQGFFARFVEKNYFKGLNPGEGRFRSYLLGALKHYLSNEADRAGAQKRGAELTVPLTLDFEQGERRYGAVPADGVSPERAYEKKWAVTFLANVLARLKDEHEKEDRAERFATLSAFLPGARHSVSYKEAAEQTGLGMEATKSAIHRLRARYRELLLGEVARTVSTPEEIDAEIRYLLKVLEH